MSNLSIVRSRSVLILIIACGVLPGISAAIDLQDAVLSGDISSVRQAINSGADINDSDKAEGTPLFIAVDSGNLEVATLLLESGSDTEIPAKRGKQTPLHRAATNNDAEMVRLLVAHGAKINSRGFQKITPLFAAVSRNNLNAIRALVEGGANVLEIWPTMGSPALHQAVFLGHLDATKLLLNLGADISQLSTKNYSVMETAVTEGSLYGAGNTNLITYLAERGAPGATKALSKLKNKGAPTSKRVSLKLYQKTIEELEQIVSLQNK
jgi:ankyrin repeat protein